jgi:hypothetical protein
MKTATKAAAIKAISEGATLHFRNLYAEVQPIAELRVESLNGFSTRSMRYATAAPLIRELGLQLLDSVSTVSSKVYAAAAA